ncbi:MAG: hypothetical protein QOI07_33 [Verrucomicrobiota bacterium]
MQQIVNKKPMLSYIVFSNNKIIRDDLVYTAFVDPPFPILIFFEFVFYYTVQDTRVIRRQGGDAYALRESDMRYDLAV